MSLLVLKKYFTRSLRSLVKYFSTLEEKFRISARPCNILYITDSYPVYHEQQQPGLEPKPFAHIGLGTEHRAREVVRERFGVLNPTQSSLVLNIYFHLTEF